jgi:SpoIID/LytB domain protein
VRRTPSVLLATLLGVAGTAVPAAADEVYSRSSSGTFSIQGHGWGHGHGMSQWGAQGGASLGRTADEITGFYYPGTAKTTLANTPIRVLLQAATGAATQVYPASGLTVTDLATGANAILPSGVDRWRSVTDSAGLHVQSLSGGTWHAFTLGGATVHTGPLDFSGSTYVRVLLPDNSSRDYRGTIRSVRTSGSSVQSLNVLPMESYLRGVVPRESSSSWKPAALQAQAIAARSYSSYKRAHAPSGQSFDICDTTQCQVYGGAAIWSGSTRTPLEPASTDDAIAATAGVIRTYQGGAIFSEFSASNGGWSTDGGVPYLVAQRDDWDGAVQNSVHSWTATLSAAQLQARYPSIGTLQRIRVTQRDGNGEWGGRVKQVVLEGVDGNGAATSVTTTGAGVYNANSWPAHSDGLRSSWWVVAGDTTSTVVSQDPAPTLVRSPGVSTATVNVTVQNSGSTTWSTSDLALVVSSPAGQADPLVGGSSTPGVYTGSAATVAPGEQATFSFALTGDGVSPGVQGRSYRLRNGSGPLFGTVVSWRIPVEDPVFTATQSGGVVSPTTPANGEDPGPVLADGRTVVVPAAGQTAVRLSYVNSGNLTWLSSAVRLGTSGPRGRTSDSAGGDWSSPARPAVLTADTSAGAAGAFDVTLHGNDKALGTSLEAFEPVWEGQAWMGATPTTLTVVRTNPSVPNLAEPVLVPRPSVSLSTGPTGNGATLVLRLRNLGGQPWTVGTDRLQSSATALGTSAWESSTRTPALARGLSRPGQTKVYPGEVGEWRIPLSAYRKAAGSSTLTLQAIAADGTLYGPVTSTAVSVTAATFSGTVTRTSRPPTFPASGRASMVMDVRNTGNTTWPLSGPVRSSASGSKSVDPSWLSASRPGALRINLTHPGAPVQPGDIARFVIVLAGNGRSAGTYSEAFGGVWEGWARLRGLNQTLTYSLTA